LTPSASARRIRRAGPLWGLAFSLALAACAQPAPAPAAPAAPSPIIITPTAAPTSTLVPTAIPTATATAVPATATAAPSTPTAVPPTPTPRPPMVGYVSAQSPAPAELDAAVAAIQRAAKGFGWEVQAGQSSTPAELAVLDLAQKGARVIVTFGQPMQAATLSAAQKFPNIYFVGLSQTGAEVPANVLLLDDTNPREDQAGFLAGMAAGFVTKTRRVAVIGDAMSSTGLRYRNGFLHGVRYTCPMCRLDAIDVLNAADIAGTADLAGRFQVYGVDVFFAAAGDAGDAALVKVTRAGAWGIGSGRDVMGPLFSGGSAAGADHILASVYIDGASAVANALALYHAGTPLTGTQSLSAATGALIMAPGPDTPGGLSALDRQDLAAMVSQLADGSFDTGIDPVTGQER
jgi:basic membrane lipoprotein Med (substrate-binding protein (PBP1-ABC) superfamily)